MKLAIISTTIHDEKGYLPYDQLAKQSKFDSVSFFISGDKKSPAFDTSKFLCPIEYLTPEMQKNYVSSEHIGWNKPARRNISLLRAIESKPDFILTIDDDNIPSDDYFDLCYQVVTSPVHKTVTPIKEITHEHWHNYLTYTDADFDMYPRGFPIPFRYKNSTTISPLNEPVHPYEIGLFQGVSLGDPDIDANTRIVYPKPEPLNALHEKNYVLKHIWSPYNSQNTIFSKKLFPLAFMWPGAGRSEDIYASYVWQRFLFNNDMYVHIGDPVNRQVRGERDNIRDLALEVESYIHGHHLWAEINKIKEKDALLFIEALTKTSHEIAERDRNFMIAFLEDLKKIL